MRLRVSMSQVEWLVLYQTHRVIMNLFGLDLPCLSKRHTHIFKFIYKFGANYYCFSTCLLLLFMFFVIYFPYSTCLACHPNSIMATCMLSYYIPPPHTTTNNNTNTIFYPQNKTGRYISQFKLENNKDFPNIALSTSFFVCMCVALAKRIFFCEVKRPCKKKM